MGQEAEPKIDGALKAMNDLVKCRTGDNDYLLANVLTIADIAGVCAVGQPDFAGIRSGWQNHNWLVIGKSLTKGRASRKRDRDVRLEVQCDIRAGLKKVGYHRCGYRDQLTLVFSIRPASFQESGIVGRGEFINFEKLCPVLLYPDQSNIKI